MKKPVKLNGSKRGRKPGIVTARELSAAVERFRTAKTDLRDKTAKYIRQIQGDIEAAI